MKRQLKYICCVVLTICLFCHFPLSFTASAALNADSADLGYPEKVASLVNEFRSENGLKPLKLAPVMLKASAIQTEERAHSTDISAHPERAGVRFWTMWD